VLPSQHHNLSEGVRRTEKKTELVLLMYCSYIFMKGTYQRRLGEDEWRESKERWRREKREGTRMEERESERERRERRGERERGERGEREQERERERERERVRERCTKRRKISPMRVSGVHTIMRS
jgi:hypothetical protein